MTTTEGLAADTPPPSPAPAPTRGRINWFAAFWRWHFYGAIIVIPVLLILATTGLTYLYRAQVDAWTHPGVLTVDVPPKAERLPLSEQEDAVRHAYPDRTILSVTDNTGDRATVFVTDLHGETHNIYVDPYQAKVTGDLTPNQLVSDWAERIHGTILLGGDGGFGDTVIELGACWAIVLTITGFIIFFLGRRPRKNAKTRGIKGTRLRSWHALIGLPVGLGILLLVLSGLPWTGFWGTHAQNLATDGNTSLWGNDPGAESTLGDLIEATDGKSGPAGWAVAGGPTGQSETSAGQTISIDTAIAAAQQVGAPGPYYVTYPDSDTGVYSVFGWQWSNNGNPAESDVSKELTIHVDQYSGKVVGEYGYDDYSVLAKAVSQGIALHEGRRFGPLNTVVTTLFCLAVMFLCISAPIMWWNRRATASGIAAPRARLPIFGNWILLIAVIALGVFLPLFGLSLLVILALDQLLIRRLPPLARFFGTV